MYTFMFSYSDGYNWDKVLNSIQGIFECIGYKSKYYCRVVQYVGRGIPGSKVFQYHQISKSNWCVHSHPPPPKKYKIKQVFLSSPPKISWSKWATNVAEPQLLCVFTIFFMKIIDYSNTFILKINCDIKKWCEVGENLPLINF